MTQISTAQEVVDFVVRRDDLQHVAVQKGGSIELAPGEVLLGIKKFAMSANNVTYALVGEQMGYWNVFPAAEGWGRIPAWGFAEVLESRHDALPVGELLFGFVPMSTHLVLKAGDVTAFGVVDASAHRASFPPLYNQYWRVENNPVFDARRDNEWALFWPLFMTAFTLYEELKEQAMYGADTVILTSASSKTALALASLLAGAKDHKPTVIALTSASNVPFVESVELFDRVLDYGSIDELPRSSALLIDLAGNSETLAAVHRHYGSDLKRSYMVGATHWTAFHGLAPDPTMPGATPTFFFAPDHIMKRLAEWGLPGLMERFATPWTEFIASSMGWLRVEKGAGPDAVEKAYRAALEGQARPSDGHILSVQHAVAD